MTPALLEKITSFVEKCAKIIGLPPVKSPSLTDYPDCDKQVKMLAEKLLGSLQTPDKLNETKFGEGTIYWGGNLTSDALYPTYKSTTELLSQMNIPADFKSESNNIRFGHRRTENNDLYFIANRTGESQKTTCTFRASGEPELW